MNNTVADTVCSVRRFTVTLMVLATLCGCRQGADKNGEAETDSANLAEEEFVADHDIAMTVSSLADAISVGEKLKATDYNFEGILTDGQGTPIYTDNTGGPGQWRVEVTGDRSATIVNTDGGDLMPEYLIKYIISNTRISDANRVPVEEPNPNDDVRMLDTYYFEGGEILFGATLAENNEGMLYPCLVITVKAN